MQSRASRIACNLICSTPPQALSSAVQPRALWVASHHAELKGKLPGNWGNLLDGIDQLLVNSINDDSYAKVALAYERALANELALASELIARFRLVLALGQLREFQAGISNP